MNGSRSLWSYAWLVVMLLWPVALLNYLDRQLMAAMKQSMMLDIPTIGSDANWGLLLGVFKWVYAFLSPLGGFIADRISRRRVILVSLVVWSAVTWATGQVETFQQLIVVRALMGISEACYIPAALAFIAEFHLGETRSRAIGLHQMAIYVGIILGGASGYIADQPTWNGLYNLGFSHASLAMSFELKITGWRFAFDVAGVIGLLYAFPLYFLLRDPPRVLDDRSTAPRASLRQVASELLVNPSFILLVLCFTLPALAGWVVRDWMPAILKKQFQLGQGQAGVSATLFVNIAAIAGVVIGGWLADRWMRFTVRGRIYVSALGMSMLIPALFGVGNASSLNIAIGFLFLFGFGWGFFDCNNMPILCQITRPEIRATGYGIMNFVSISCGGLADYGFGYLQDLGVKLNLIFGVFGLIALMSVVFVLMIRPRNATAT